MEEKESAVKAGLNAGLILGIGSAILMFLVYFINPNFLVAGSFGFGLLILFVVVSVVLGIRYRKSIGGFISFGEAYKFSIIAFLVLILVSFVTGILLYTVIDTGLPSRLADQSIENTLAIMEKFGAADAFNDDQIDEMKESILEGYTFFGLMKTNLISLIIYGILALIVAAIVKKKDKSLEY
ncbi:DUF4199 domain-containing protein [Cecembia rubra]|uniref:Uncharacterized protein DUF4199 n=1 Tax=Cecembia rubra TaxID=1485585 RepID=A0A2P8DWA1_9BACT|nr:DUF4199 domain-containing protein [Cecembia rubra]PSL01509.1 uncharacterized protein DUF4199 [Cecembia rubra]